MEAHAISAQRKSKTIAAPACIYKKRPPKQPYETFIKLLYRI